MSQYYNCLVAAVPSSNKQTYREHAVFTAAILKEYGALNIVECWGDDVPDGKLTSFPMAVQLKEGETVVCSWIVWPDKATQDQGMEKFMADPRLESMSMPFDGKRMIFGGFSELLNV